MGESLKLGNCWDPEDIYIEKKTTPVFLSWNRVIKGDPRKNKKKKTKQNRKPGVQCLRSPVKKKLRSAAVTIIATKILKMALIVGLK